eukprot:2893811-Lingulodinium_polyedra.AAC.1
MDMLVAAVNALTQERWPMKEKMDHTRASVVEPMANTMEMKTGDRQEWPVNTDKVGQRFMQVEASE